MKTAPGRATWSREKWMQPAAPGFGVLLRMYRDRAGFSVTRLAERAAYTEGAISRIERGERNASKDAVERIGRALGLSADEQCVLLAASIGLSLGDVAGALRAWPEGAD